MLSAPISSMISTVDPFAVANKRHPFIRNFMLPVPEASCPAVLQKTRTQHKNVILDSGILAIASDTQTSR